MLDNAFININNRDLTVNSYHYDIMKVFIELIVFLLYSCCHCFIQIISLVTVVRFLATGVELTEWPQSS